MGITTSATITGVTSLAVPAISNIENDLNNDDNSLINNDFNAFLSSEVSIENESSAEAGLLSKSPSVELEKLLALLEELSSQLELATSSPGPTTAQTSSETESGKLLPQTGNALPEALASIQSLVESINRVIGGIAPDIAEQALSDLNASQLPPESSHNSTLSDTDTAGLAVGSPSGAITQLLDSVTLLVSQLKSIADSDAPLAQLVVDPALLLSRSAVAQGLGNNGGGHQLSESPAVVTIQPVAPAIAAPSNTELLPVQGAAIPTVASSGLTHDSLRTTIDEINGQLKAVFAKLGFASKPESASVDVTDHTAKALGNQFTLGLDNGKSDYAGSPQSIFNTAAATSTIASVDTALIGDTLNAADPSENWQAGRSWLQSVVTESSLRPPGSAPIFRANLDLPVTSEPWGQQLGQRLNWMISQGLSAAELMLNPAELGPLKIRVEQSEQSTRVAFVVQHSATREILETQLPRLRDMFAEQGLDLVDVESHDMSQFAQSQAGAGGRQGADDGEGFLNTEPTGTASDEEGADGQLTPGKAPQLVVAQLQVIDTFA